MGNRAHDQLLEKYPFLKRTARGFHADGPQPWIKRKWVHKLRMRWKMLAQQDPDTVAWPTKAGDDWEWY